MRVSRISSIRTLAASTVIGIAASLVAAPTAAFAAYNDSFATYTTNNCGMAEFIDYGEGKPGGGNNDDYMVIHDYCADGRVVVVGVYLNNVYLDSESNTNGAAGAAVIWDPFQAVRDADLIAGDKLKVTISLIEYVGSEDFLYRNNSGWVTIVDG